MTSFILLFVGLTGNIYLGTYLNESACKNAIYEIVATRMNPPNQRLPELKQAIDTELKYQKTMICVPTKT